MNKLFTKIAALALGATMAVGVGVAVASNSETIKPASATEATAYTMSITKDTGNSGYASSKDASITSNAQTITWNIPGNQTLGNYTKLGGKLSSATTRSIYSKGTISQNITRIVVSTGAKDSQITVTSMTVTAHDTAANAASGSSAVSTFTFTYAASSSPSATKSGSTDLSAKYWRFNLTMTSTAPSSNKGAIINSITFYYDNAPAKTLSSISVATVPTKTTYTIGETFDPTGLVIRRTYSDSSSDTYAYAGHTTEFDFSPSLSTPLTASDVSVSITYSEKQTTQAITVKALSSIAVTTAPTKTVYFEGDSFDPSGMVVTATYSDSSTANVTASCTFSPNPLTTNTAAVTITYAGKTTTQAVTVNEKHGTKTNPYTVSEALAAIQSGEGVTGVWATGIVSQIVTEYSSQYHNVTFDISSDGTTTGDQLRAYRCQTGDVTISSSDDVFVGDIVIVGGNLTDYQGTKEFSQGCTLDSRTRKTISSLTVTDNSGKTWFDGDTVSTTDLQVVVNYSNDTHETITDGTGVTITSGGTLSEGSNTVNVSFTNVYGTQTGSVSITAGAVAVLDSVTITGTAYADKNESWDFTDLTVIGTSQGGSAGDMGDITEECSLTSSASTSTPGSTTITVHVNYKNGTKELNVENIPAVIRNIEKYTDIIDRALTEVEDTSYENWSGKQDQSDAIYAGNSAGGNDAVQLRSNNSNSGVVSTASGGELKSITINFNSNTPATRVVSVYGKTTAYSAATDLYSSSTHGTLLGEVNVDNGASQTINVSDSYQYVGIRSKSGALYLDSIEIVWANEVQTKTLESLSVTTNPTKTTYAAGETLNLTGMVVTAHYEEEGVEDAPTVAFTTSPIEGYTFTSEDGETGYKVITITSTEDTEITTSFNVTVTPKKPTALNRTTAATWTDTQTLADGAGRWKAVFSDSTELTNIKIGDSDTVLKIGGVAVDTSSLAKNYAGQQATLEYTSQNVTVTNSFEISVSAELSVDSFEDVPEYVLVTDTSELITANFTSLNGEPDSYSVTSSNPSKLSVEFDSSVAEYNSTTKKGFLYFSVTGGNSQGEYMVTVSVTKGSRTESKSVTITVRGEAPAPAGVQYQRITSLDDVTTGKYVIATNVNGTYYALPSITSGKITAETVTVSNDIISETDAGSLPLDIIRSSNTVAVGKTSGNNTSYLKIGTSADFVAPTSDPNYCDLSLAGANKGGTFIISSGTRCITYRTGTTNKFAPYATSNLNGTEYYAVELFKQVSSSTEKTSFDWVKEFVDGYMYMNVIPVTDKGTGACMGENGYYLTAKRAWHTMVTAYAEAGGTDNLVEVFEESFPDAYARYMAWASACGDSDPFNGTTIQSKVNPISIIGSNSNVNVIAIVVITSVVSLTAIGGYFFLRKRREQN